MTDGWGFGPFEAVRELRYDAPFPRLVRVRQKFDASAVADVTAATTAALRPLRGRIRTGMTVAVTAGSRGIHDMPAVLRAAGEFLRSLGAEPFVVPAMGSHGGATAAGQVQLLAELGVTGHSVGMEIRSSMDTVELGRLPGGPEVYLDRHAAAADGILLVNRIKPHTDFNSGIESGLAKIAAVGLGKQRGAQAIHQHGPANLGVWIPEAARRIVETGRVLGGVAIVENARDRAAAIEFVEPAGIGGDGEARLLRLARSLMGALPFDEIDVAVVDVIGKNKSGTGMDTNVIGRMMIRGTPEFDRPRIGTIAALDISEESHGNAVGVGLADFVPLRVLEKIDLRAMYVNAMTAGLAGLQRAQIPIVLPTDRDAIAAAILACGRADVDRLRLVRMPDTLDLQVLLASEALADDIAANPALEVVSEPMPMSFDATGRIEPLVAQVTG